MDRHVAIQHILEHLSPEDLLLTTTGMISREAFHLGDRPANFYMLGSMGLLSSFGLGLAIMHPQRRVIVVDGDGSFLMTLGNVPLIAYEAPVNLHHFILDNGSYQSTGAQPSIASRVGLAPFAEAAGYRLVASVSDPGSLTEAVRTTLASTGPTCLHVKVDISQVPDIPRVTLTPEEIRDRFAGAIG